MGSNLVASGALSAADPDAGQSSFQAANINGTYGSLAINTAGVWTYTASASQAGIQSLGAGVHASDDFTVYSQDGSASQVIHIDIEGTNDAAIITGTSSGAVQEDVGANLPDLKVSGDLDVSDADTGQDVFQAANLTGTYGSLVIDTSGSWTYTALNSQSGIQSLGAGVHAFDNFTVYSQDGSASQVIHIDIEGTNDAAIITGTSSGAVQEDVGANLPDLKVSGNLDVSDVDTGQDVFQAANLAGTYGSLEIDAAGGWTYTASNSQASIQSLGAGVHAFDNFTVYSQDGSASQVIHIDILGTNDAAVITGTSTAALQEDVDLVGSDLVANGKLDVSDVDTGQDVFQAANLTGTYGSLFIDTSGSWIYTALNSQANIQSLGAGVHAFDNFTVYSQDGSASQVIHIDIEGTNDAAIITGTSSGAVQEDVGANLPDLKVSGDLDVSDADTGQDVFQAANLTGTYGSLVIDTSGSWTYTALNSQSSIQSLGAGVHAFDNFTVYSEDGSASQVIHIDIEGTNDAAVITGTSSGAVQEDVGANLPDLIASGDLNVTDVDTDEASFQAETLVGAYGSLEIDADGGWTYTALSSNANIQALGAGVHVSDDFTVRSEDGTSQLIHIDLEGTNDAAVITGTSTGAVTEDVGVSGGNIIAA